MFSGLGVTGIATTTSWLVLRTSWFIQASSQLCSQHRRLHTHHETFGCHRHLQLFFIFLTSVTELSIPTDLCDDIGAMPRVHSRAADISLKLASTGLSIWLKRANKYITGITEITIKIHQNQLTLDQKVVISANWQISSSKRCWGGDAFVLQNEPG